MATIKDIARLAGVGIGTVSRVLNGGTNVKAETMKRVLNAAKKLNFRVNKSARDLARKGFSRTAIGIALPIVVHPFYFEILKGVYEQLHELDYNLMVFNVGEKTEEVFEHIIGESLPGVLVVARAISPEMKQRLEISGSCFLYLDYFEEGDNSFFIDNRKGGSLAANYLLSKKVKHIAYVGEKFPSQQQEERFAGFRDRLSAQGIDQFTTAYIANSEDEAYNVTQELLSQDIDGIFYFCDSMAYGGVRAVREMKSKTVLVGYDDMEPSRYLGLTSIRQPAFEMGRRGAKGLVEIIENGDSVIHKTALEPLLIERD